MPLKMLRCTVYMQCVLLVTSHTGQHVGPNAPAEVVVGASGETKHVRRHDEGEGDLLNADGELKAQGTGLMSAKSSMTAALAVEASGEISTVLHNHDDIEDVLAISKGAMEVQGQANTWTSSSMTSEVVGADLSVAASGETLHVRRHDDVEDGLNKSNGEMEEQGTDHTSMKSLSTKGHTKKGELHLGTFDDDDAADDDVIVRQHMLLSQEFAQGQLTEDGSAELSEHTKVDKDAVVGQKLTKETWEDVLTIFCVIFMIVGAIAFLVFLCFFNKKQQASPRSTGTETTTGKGDDKSKGQDSSPGLQSDGNEEDDKDSPGSNKSKDRAAEAAHTASPKVPEQVDRDDSDRVVDPRVSRTSTVFVY